ncbi:hypothetical protein IMG5_129380 [Ichthyophthirius multifiliis]|uniref:Tetratricopeptide repeat protein 29 n=1 Tax=Ichthyophthirius multifiliis TaxID=5932 RepID=G0QW49_ICHMU|nr:hypothetical protein IMG5_129380 [Ichthyophthirius multifiliis]EGR30552.1 hypothetical protein IMG5_129380 [Ichthyophthirius multifiliis]|eukprot:XP_004032139.1 hypothetical protein IMG5_129380 [Ichthyophthirius multifiliis]
MPQKKTNQKTNNDIISMHGEQQENIQISIHQKKHGKGKQTVEQVGNDEEIQFTGKVNKQTLAMDILKEGYVQSFIDFFYITQTPQDSDNLERYTTSMLLEQQEDKLLSLKKDLIEAEDATKYIYSDKSSAIEGYFKLAENFFDNFQDYKTAQFFYKRCISISKDSEDKISEGKGKLGYGKCFDRQNKTPEAIEILEKSLADAEAIDQQSIVELISKELIQIYHKVAQNFEKGESENISNALYYYEKCLDVAKKADKEEDEGNICHKIGLLYYKIGNYQRSIDFQKKYLEIYQPMNSEEGKQRQMEAHAALAKCYLKMNANDDAQIHLEKYIEHAEKLHLNNSQSDAALHLATLYAQKGNVPKSLEYYKQHFDGARTEKPDKKDRKLVDRARVTLGIAKSNATIGNFFNFYFYNKRFIIDKYIEIVKNSDKDIYKLLEWKAKKDK